MPNMPRRGKADKAKYEGKEYLDYDEAADYLGIKRATLYNYVNDLDIETHKFKRDRRRYLAIADVKRLEEVKEKPWLAGHDRKEKRSGEERISKHEGESSAA
jgi:excisionase family DNA binding protein